MTSKVRMLLCLLLAVFSTIFLVNCGGYSCRVTFGGSCTSSGSGFGGGPGPGGGGGSSAFAFAVNTAGAVDGYTLSSTAFVATSGFTAPAVPAGTVGAGMVVAQQRGQTPYIYAMFGTPSNQLFGWSMNSSGLLTLLPNLPATISLLPNTAILTNQYQMAVNPAGTLLFIADTFASEIFVFQIATNGALTEVTGSPFSTPVLPGNLVTDGQGKYLYVTETTSNHTGVEVLGYSIGSGSSLGVLTELPGSPFAFKMWQLQGDASGSFLIGTTGNSKASGLSGVDDDTLYVFNITPSGANAGNISQLGTIATTNSPLNIAVQPPFTTGEFVYSFGVNDTGTGYNPVEGFQLNTTTGALTRLTGSPFSGPQPGYWGQFDQSGANLIVYATVTNGSTTETELIPLAIASNGIPAQPVSPVTIPTQGYWVITDAQ